jgi:hypothetical protein
VVATIAIRTADERDVLALIEYVAALRAERLPTIFRYDSVPTVEQEIAFIRRFAGKNAAFFVAVIDGRIVGNLGVVAHQHAQTAHGASLGMSVLALVPGPRHRISPSRQCGRMGQTSIDPQTGT